MNSIASLANTATGTCYILGNSSSLDLVDSHGLVLSRLPCIGVNRILRWHSHPQMVLLADKSVLSEERDRLNAAKPRLLLWRGLIGSLGSLGSGLDVRTWLTHGGPYHRGWKPGRPAVWKQGWKNSAFWHTGNTATYALEAAAMIGYRDLRMLGVDLRFDLPRSHIQGQNIVKGRRVKYTPRALQNVVKGFRLVIEGLRGLGCTVTNESAYTGPLDEFVPRSECPWQKTSQ